MRRPIILRVLAVVLALVVGYIAGRAKSTEARAHPRAEHWSGPIVVRQVRDELHTDVILELLPFKVIVDGKPQQFAPAPEGAAKAYVISFPEAGVQVLATAEAQTARPVQDR